MVPEACHDCGTSYRRTVYGIRFASVRKELRAEIHRVRVTRHTVLGRMHEIKRLFWNMDHGPGRCVPAHY